MATVYDYKPQLVGQKAAKGIGDPCARYESLQRYYKKARAIVDGQQAAKEHDAYLDLVHFSNLLLPFSSSMTLEQYSFYKSEAELPGLVSQYLRVIVSGLIRKTPIIELPENVPEGASSWLIHNFEANNRGLISFLHNALSEELTTSRAWVAINYPYIGDKELTSEQVKALKPYPILLKAESVINWREGVNPVTNEIGLVFLAIRQYVEKYENFSDPHPKLIDTLWVHRIGETDGLYYIDVYEKEADAATEVIAGEYQQNYQETEGNSFQLVRTEADIKSYGERLNYIPIYPLNGSIQALDPFLMPLIDREVALYNKVSRRNHLLYGAATYTPVISSDMDDEEFNKVSSAGLGSWLKVGVDDKISILDTPTAALNDMDRAIEQNVLEMGRLGIRMLTPDVRDQTGPALEIRNAPQTAQLGTLNARISQVMSTIIAVMLNWRYGTDYNESDIEFTLSTDFNPVPLGDAWLRLIGEWYESGTLSRSTFIDILKQNDVLRADYDDSTARDEIMNDDLIAGPPVREMELDVEKHLEMLKNSQEVKDTSEEDVDDDN